MAGAAATPDSGSARGVSAGAWVLLALALALGAGAAIAATGDATALRLAKGLAPIGTLWVNAIRMTVIPLVVSLLITGVASAADLKTIGRIGGRTLVVFVGLLAALSAITIPLLAWTFSFLPPPATRPPLPPGAAEAASEIAAGGGATSFGAWITTLLPTNPVAAASQGAMLPLVVFTLLFALAVAQSPPTAREPLLRFFGALGDAMLVLVRWVIAVAPIGVFALVLPLAAQSGAALVGGVGFYVAVYAAGSVASVLLLYPAVAAAGGVGMARFARAALPAQMIGVSSSSSIASLPALVESAERGLALPPRVVGFVLPLAVSTFKLAAPVAWTCGALFVGWFYGVPLGARELATIGLAAVFLGFTAPGIPRGAFLMLAPLFVAIGLPVEGIGILIAVDAIPDVCATVVNVTGDLVAAAVVAKGDRQPA
jgi:Na+/H+-dicarboxylate symporter